MKIGISYQDILLRLLVATIVGIILGIERSIKHKTAGLRTHTLVCISTTSIAIISAYGFEEFRGVTTMDPARLIVGIITGIGFLGAGIIWREPLGGVQGVTTAANIWATAGLGIGVGLGHFFLVFATVAFIFVALHISNVFEKLNFVKKTPPNCESESEHPVHHQEES
ncbi:MgtC/SapB family protein [Dehalobacterium formicoaceticum]|uniref:MgtC/SapB family protein n=1 Tax=Dehalobacterium formicoaceticum TaxID=51515 RepID=A0ABT1Y6W2_9FIRM|nr:MgtC/SapB family protein [Dehalobacterium formicoaceticum]MCR6546293.1 MgtC/SapB family protein [Dehalobacterium formicoaceticum]